MGRNQVLFSPRGGSKRGYDIIIVILNEVKNLIINFIFCSLFLFVAMQKKKRTEKEKHAKSCNVSHCFDPTGILRIVLASRLKSFNVPKDNGTLFYVTP